MRFPKGIAFSLLLICWVADERGRVADEEDDLVAELLEVAQLAHEHGVAEVEVGGGGIKAGLDAQRAAGFPAVFEALAEVGDADDFGRAFLEQVKLFVYGQERTHSSYEYIEAGSGDRDWAAEGNVAR